MRLSPRTFLALVLVVIGAVGLEPSEATGQQGAGPRPLFAAVRGPEAAAAARPTEPEVVRQRLVNVDTSLLLSGSGEPSRRAGRALLLELFPGTEALAFHDRSERNASGSISWYGRVADDPLGNVILVVHDGRVTGTVALSTGLYRISPRQGTAHTIQQIDVALLPPEAEPGEVDLPPTPDIGPMVDSGAVIDIMVAYTAAARAAAGGTANMLALIDLAMSETNQGYDNSDINPDLALVHTEEVVYAETGNSQLDRDRLQNPADGFMDNIHALRDSSGADLVALIVENGGGFCGIAYIMTTVSTGFAPFGFQVTARNCAAGNYTFGHEFGHIQGARHDRYVDPSSTPYTYGHGYVNLDIRKRTVMAYNNRCADTAPGTFCQRILWWSTPDTLYTGNVIGLPEGNAQSADNHRVLNNTAMVVANFRPSAGPPAAPTNLAGTGASTTQIDLTWTDNAGNESGYKLWHRFWEGSAWGPWSAPTELPANTEAHSVTGLTQGRYQFWLRAFNGAGNSPSIYAKIYTDGTAPTAPSGLAGVGVSTTQIDITWNDNSSTEEGFQVYRRRWNGSGWNGLVYLGLKPANTEAYSATGLTEGKYQFWVRSSNHWGKSPVITKNILTDGSPPAAPTNLVGTGVSASQIDLTWDDNATNEAGYKLWHRHWNGSSWSAWTYVGVLPADSTSRSVTGLPSGQNQFWLRAFNDWGNSGSIYHKANTL